MANIFDDGGDIRNEDEKLERLHAEFVSSSKSTNSKVIWKSSNSFPEQDEGGEADKDFARLSHSIPSSTLKKHLSASPKAPLPPFEEPPLNPPQTSNSLSLTSSRKDKQTAPPKSSFGRVRVIVRCRPLLQSDSSHSTERLYVDRQHVGIRECQNSSSKRFTFDRVLSSEATQQDVFMEVFPLVEHTLNGFNASVLAYGQTGSGKTFTIDGLQYTVSPSVDSDGNMAGTTVVLPDVRTPVERHGLLLRVIQMMFDLASMRERESIDMDTGEPKEGATTYSFQCSFLQIYNEKITDLLQSGGTSHSANLDKSKTVKAKKGAPPGKAFPNTSSSVLFGPGLRLRWCKGDVFRVQNLFLCECESPQTMRNAFFRGVKEKVMASHSMNQQSSRSHCIFTIYVIRSDARTGDVVGRSEFSLVDLAGSEKLNSISADHRTTVAKESIDINTSLLALGKVIVALSNAKGKHASDHIPYRESNLTKLLKHALGGNSLTTMIACISPSDAHVEESISTLLYAGRAKNIENEPQLNEDPNFAIIRELREEIQQLKQELQYYRRLAQNGLICSEVSAKNGAISPSSITSNKTEQSRLSGNGRSQEVDDKVSAMEKDELADSLLSACEMLQHIIGANSELRDAYDTLKLGMERANLREIHLNAENLVLRERIEMLESIVLNEEFMKVTTKSGTLDSHGLGSGSSDSGEEDEESDDVAQEDISSSSIIGRRMEREGDSFATLEVEELPISGNSPGVDNRESKKNKSKPIQTEGAVHSHDFNGNLQNNSTGFGERKREIVHDGADRDSESRKPYLTSSLPRRGERQRFDDVLPSSSEGFPTEHREPQKRAGSSRRGPRAPSHPVWPNSSESIAPRKERVSSSSYAKKGGSRHGRVGSRSKDSGVIRRGKNGTPYNPRLARQLAEYNKRYRHPQRTSTYADYYGKASNGMPAMIANSRVSSSAGKSIEAIKLMDNVLQVLPREIVKEVVPSSLKKTENFGKLSFVGSTKEISDFEKRREEREEKLRNLLEKNRELNKMVQKEIASPLQGSEKGESHGTPSEQRRSIFSLSSPEVFHSHQITGGSSKKYGPQKSYYPSEHTTAKDGGSRKESKSRALRQTFQLLNENIPWASKRNSDSGFFSNTLPSSPPSVPHPPTLRKISSIQVDNRPKTASYVSPSFPLSPSRRDPVSPQNRYSSSTSDFE